MISGLRRRLQVRREDRGAALVEFAIAIPIFVALIALIFDAGLGYAAARSTSSAARSAARIGALAGEAREADFRVLDALRAEFGDGEGVRRIVVYVTDPNNPIDIDDPGAVPPECGASVLNTCNVYDGSILAVLDNANFESATNPVTGEATCADEALDAKWCPLGRRAFDGMALGVYVEVDKTAAVGLGAKEFTLADRAVFSMFFPPEASSVTATN